MFLGNDKWGRAVYGCPCNAHGLLVEKKFLVMMGHELAMDPDWALLLSVIDSMRSDAD